MTRNEPRNLVATVSGKSQHRRGSFTAARTAEGADLFPPVGAFNLSLWGTFTGSAVLERLLPGETVWVPVSTALGAPAAPFTAPASLVVAEPELGTLYRLRCTDLSAGEMFWRLSQ